MHSMNASLSQKEPRMMRNVIKDATKCRERTDLSRWPSCGSKAASRGAAAGASAKSRSERLPGERITCIFAALARREGNSRPRGKSR